MPRTPRFDYAGATHHAFNRGASHEAIFLDDDDRIAFLAVLALLPPRFAVHVLAFALMTNHFHLVLATPRANLSAAMKYLQGVYSHRFNARHGRDGSPFRGRFANRVVETEDYLRNALAYVHANPVAAGMVDRAVDARWTSHRFALGVETAPDWLELDWVSDLFGGREAFAIQVDGWKGEPFDAETPCTEILETTGAADVTTTSISEVLGLAARIAGTSRPRIRAARGRPGQFVAWTLAARGGLTHDEVAVVLRITRMAATHRIRRFEAWSATHPAGRAGRQAVLR